MRVDEGERDADAPHFTTRRCRSDTSISAQRVCGCPSRDTSWCSARSHVVMGIFSICRRCRCQPAWAQKEHTHRSLHVAQRLTGGPLVRAFAHRRVVNVATKVKPVAG
jgi:hypothetical protein